MFMKKNKIRTYWLIIATFAVFCWYSLKIIISSKLNRLSRNRATHHCRTGFAKVLKLAKATCKLQCNTKLNFSADRAYIFMSNHQSLYDLPVIFTALPGHIRLLAKKELFDIPIFGKAMHYTETISINREDPTKTAAQFLLAKEKLQSGIRLWIFPEATRSRDGKLLPFKLGGFRLALETNAIIIPVGISGTKDILPPDTFKLATEKNVILHTGEPIDTANYSSRSLNKLRQDVAIEIASLINNQ
jgi:1-acyl-sn-glycerol-3-phosphate acyltransferase